MTTLAKAKLQKIAATEDEKPLDEAFAVQFNPSSLKLRITNQIEGGRSTARQTRQQTGKSSRTLTLDLYFDTADEGTTAKPVSVRSKTQQLEQFVMTPEGDPDTPPKLKFSWGDLTIVGIVDGLEINLEHFAANGYPLRAKCGLSIKEQDPTLQFKPSNRGSDSATKPGGKSGLPGSGTNPSGGLGVGTGSGVGFGVGFGIGGGLGIGASLGAGAKFGVALGGETGAEFAARMGLSPSAWRGLDAPLGGDLSLKAGTQIGFDKGLQDSPGVGKSAGFAAKSSVKQSATSALAPAGTSADKNTAKRLDGDESGKAMAQLGGVGASINAQKTEQVDIAANETKASFGMAGAKEAVAMPAISRAPLNNPSITDDTQSSYNSHVSQTGLDGVDQRAITYGLGLPLQPLLGSFAEHLSQVVYASRTHQTISSTEQSDAPIATNATVPGWVALPADDSNRIQLDNTRSRSSKACRCKE